MCDDKAHLRGAYCAAVQSLSPLVRAVFLLHRIDGLPYEQIGDRLSIEKPVVMACFARALVNIARSLEPSQPFGPEPAIVAEAEAILLKEYLRRRAGWALHRTLHPPQMEEGEVESEMLGHWFGSLRQWLAHKLKGPEGRYAQPPFRSFDEWLRERQGPAAP